jgi:magnesium chelatase subunit I
LASAYRDQVSESTGPAPDHLPRTLGTLRASGHRYQSIKAELRTNLLAAMAAGRPRFPGIVGFDATVLPELERALLAGHDLVLLGERGQGKTRLIRSLVTLLDEWTPVIDGAELGEHPYRPVTPTSRRRAVEMGDDLPVAWRHRDDRYSEKLATPDTSVGDLIGDVDPIRVAQGRTLGDPETIHFGLVPRTHRGIFAINELPDLAERIQVALLNVLEERDVQVRGYQLRLPLDLLLVASANPEDYTNRGRIITPLKDRFGAEVRTHYPLDLDAEIALVRQEADLVAEVPDHVLEALARFTRGVRESPSVDARSPWRPPRRWRRARCAGPRCARRSCRARTSMALTPPSRRWPGSATPSRWSPPCAARWSSREARRAARSRSWPTC